MKACWFTAPRDVLPDTTILPGRLVVDPRSPEGPPYLEPPLPVPADSLRVTNYPWTHERETERGGSFGLFASFASAIGVGGDVSGNLKVGSSLKIEVDRLQTSMFEPSEEYLEETLNLPKNLAFLKEQMFKRSLYIVTGVKIAYGAKLTRSKSTEWGGDGKLGVSPHVPGLEVGPTASFVQKAKETETLQGPTDFVFAFRLNKLHYSRRRSRYIQEAFTKGALYSDEVRIGDEEEENEPEQTSTQEEAQVEVEVEGMEDEDAGEDESNMAGQSVIDEEDGEPCIVIIPEARRATTTTTAAGSQH